CFHQTRKAFRTLPAPAPCRWSARLQKNRRLRPQPENQGLRPRFRDQLEWVRDGKPKCARCATRSAWNPSRRLFHRGAEWQVLLLPEESSKTARDRRKQDIRTRMVNEGPRWCWTR